MADFQIGAAQRSCNHCSLEIRVGQIYFSTIQFSNDEINRLEFCVECWELNQNIGVYWKTKSRRAKEKPQPLDLKFLWELFLASSENSPYLNYFLGLVLMRKRTLDFVKTIQSEGQRFLVLRAKKDRKLIKIKDLSSKVLELERIQRELEIKLPDVTF